VLICASKKKRPPVPRHVGLTEEVCPCSRSLGQCTNWTPPAHPWTPRPRVAHSPSHPSDVAHFARVGSRAASPLRSHAQNRGTRASPTGRCTAVAACATAPAHLPLHPPLSPFRASAGLSIHRETRQAGAVHGDEAHAHTASGEGGEADQPIKRTEAGARLPPM